MFRGASIFRSASDMYNFKKNSKEMPAGQAEAVTVQKDEKRIIASGHSRGRQMGMKPVFLHKQPPVICVLVLFKSADPYFEQLPELINLRAYQHCIVFINAIFGIKY